MLPYCSDDKVELLYILRAGVDPMVVCPCISGHSTETVILESSVHHDRELQKDGGG